MRRKSVLFILSTALSCMGAAAQVSQIQRSPVRPNAAMHAPYTGTISGFLYWDTSRVKNVDPENCAGISMYAGIDNGSWGSWSTIAYNLTYSSSDTLAICAYTITGAPTGVPLSVGVFEVNRPYIGFGVNLWELAAPGNKAEGLIAWGGESTGEDDVIKISNTPCSALTPRAYASQPTLESGPRTCGNKASNVNVLLISDTSQILSFKPSGSAGSKPLGTATPALLKQPAPRRGSSREVNTLGARPSTQMIHPPSSSGQPTPQATQPPYSMAPSAANAQTRIRLAQGTVAGAIFWDSTRVAYNPSVPCQGLQVALSDIDATGSHSLATTNQFQFTQSPRPGPGNRLCSYSFSRVPEGVALQVQVTIAQPFVSRVAANGPFGAQGGLIKIAGGPCNNTSSGTALSLESGWQSCGEDASNVNFELVPRNAVGPLPPNSGVLLQQTPAASMSSRPMLSPGGGSAGPSPIPAKGNEHSAYEAVTVQRGVTSDPNFTKWTNSNQAPNGIAGTAPARGALLTSNQVLAGPCTGSGLVVSALRLEFKTGKDDLRGGDNNLDVEVHFKNNTFQPALNVNKGANWPNGSVNRVDIVLNEPVRADQISEIHLVHNAQASFPNSQDNWEMTQMRVLAMGQGKTENIANYGFNDFTGDSPELTVPISCAPAPGMVNALYFDVFTGSDDLKGDSFDALAPGPNGNNLDVIVGFSNGSTEHAPNVNGGANWANNSEHKFFVYLSQPMDFTEIKSITLQTVLQRFGTDKWNMNSVQVTAVGNGVNKLIATHGFYRFGEGASLNLDMVTH